MGETGTLRRMKGALPLLGMLLAVVALPVSAGTLYKCVGADGVPAYVSKRMPGASCAVVSHYTPDRKAGGVATPATVGSVSTAATPVTQSGSLAPKLVEVSSSGSASTASPATLPKPSGGVVPIGPTQPRRVVSGQVYSYIKDGVRHYTSAKPRGAGTLASLRVIKYSYIETCYACGNPGLNFGTLRLNTSAYQAEIAAASREFGVEESVIRAIMHAESSYNPMALSRVGAQGLMQLMPATARRFGVTDAFNAGQNIRGGVKYLAWLLKRYNGDLTKAAAGYNAGEGAVDRHGGVPPYSETQRYVHRVGQLAERYRGMLAAK